MDNLSRQEYPAMLASLPPLQAVSVLNERLTQIGRVNTDIANWLAERRKVEEAYVLGLRRLARNPAPGNQADLGVFAAPWQQIVKAVEAIATAHQLFSARIDKDVEQPLRNYATKNRDMQSMSTMQGNLGAMAKELDEARQKAEKLDKKGGKANSVKVDKASQQVEHAEQQWDSQAPFIFEKLQELDESRINHLRGVLTQYETHESDEVELIRSTAESCLTSLLEVDTATEINNFARAATQGKPRMEPRRRTPSSATTLTAQREQTPVAEDHEEPAMQPTPEKTSGLKRLGTMLGRRRQSVQGNFMRAPSPTKGNYSSLGRGLGSRDGRPSPSPRASSGNLRESTSRADNRLSVLPELPPPTTEHVEETGAATSRGVTNGEFTGFRPGSLLNPHPAPPTTSGSENVNGIGTISETTEYQPPPGPPPSQLQENAVPSAHRDSEGFSVPSASNDPIAQAMREAADATNEGHLPGFKVDIKNEPIREEDSADAQAALSNVANTLRSVGIPTPSRKAGTVRGRRDVRNTIFIPNPADVSESRDENVAPLSPEQSFSNSKSPVLAHLEHSTSDAQSIRSQRSLTGAPLVRHPDMHQPGLNASIVETVNASFEDGRVVSGTVVGEVALAYGHSDALSLSSFPVETVRFNNFGVLEAMAPNHAFVSEVSPDRRGEYTIQTTNISKPTIGFRYKVFIDSTNLSSHCPIILKPAWKPQGDKLGLIIEYSLNPAFGPSKVTVHNLLIMAHYEGPKSASCQTKPVGTHLKDKNIIAWRLGDVTLDVAATTQKVVARINSADGAEPQPGLVNVQWEVELSGAVPPPGSGLSVSRLETGGEGKGKGKETDPFADDGSANPPGSSSSAADGNWVKVESHRRIIGGKYDAK